MSYEYEKYIKQPTESLSITSNGTYDVTEKAQVVVNASKTEETFTATPKITSQTITPTSGNVFSSGTVNPIYEEISTSAGMDAVNIDANIGKMYKFTGETDEEYCTGGLYIVENSIELDKFSIPTDATLLYVTKKEVST